MTVHARYIVLGKVHRRILRAGLQYRLCARLHGLAVGLAAEARLRPEAGQQHSLGGGARRVRQQQRVAHLAGKIAARDQAADDSADLRIDQARGGAEIAILVDADHRAAAGAPRFGIDDCLEFHIPTPLLDKSCVSSNGN